MRNTFIRIGIIGGILCFVGCLLKERIHYVFGMEIIEPIASKSEVSHMSRVVTRREENSAMVCFGSPSFNETRLVSKRAETIAFIERSLRDWKAETDPDKRKEILDQLIPLLTDENAAAIAKSLSKEFFDTDFASIALQRWVRSDRASAADWMAAQSSTTVFQAGLITCGWLQQDAEGMHKYLESLPPGDWRENVLNAASNNALTASDPLEAISFANDMLSGESRDALLIRAAEQWAQTDPQKAAGWASGISDAQLRDKLNQSVVAGFATIDPAKAAELITQSMSSGEPMAEAVADVSGIWSAKDPAAAADWIEQIPAGESQQLALDILLNQWGVHDLAAVNLWIENLPQGLFRNEAEAAFFKVKEIVEAN